MAGSSPRRLAAALAARVQRQHHAARQLPQARENSGKAFGVVGVGRSVYRGHEILPLLQAEFLCTLTAHWPTREQPHAVGHDVADVVNARGNPLRGQLTHRNLRGREKPRGQMIGHNAVDFFGHPAIEAAQSRLDVGHANVQLRRGQRPGHGRVRIAVNNHRVGLYFAIRVRWRSASPRFVRVRARADAQMPVGRRDVQLAKEYVRHVIVIVSARVYEELFVFLSQFRAEAPP